MTKRRITRLLLIASPMLILFSQACSNGGCLENRSSIPLAKFYSSPGNELISIDSLRIYGIGAIGDSSLTSTAPASSVYLPLRSTIDRTAFCIHYLHRALSSPLLNDTLIVDYDSDARFISEECGALYFYNIIAAHVTTHVIDSVVVTNPEVNNISRENIRIYFRVETDNDSDDDDNTQSQQS